jgi:hypothetical protein
VGQRDQTLPYGQSDASEPDTEREPPAETIAQPAGRPAPPPAQIGETTLTHVGSGSFAEHADAASAADAPDPAASGSWKMPGASSEESNPGGAARWHPANAEKKRDPSAPPVASGSGVILTVGWIEQILDLSLGHEIDIQVAGLGRDFKVELSERAIVDVLASLAAYVRENMPNGGTLTMQAAHIELKEPHFAKKLELPLGRYVFLGLSHISRPGASASGVFREPSYARRGLDTVMKMIKNHRGSVTVNESEGRVMGFSIYLPTPHDQ